MKYNKPEVTHPKLRQTALFKKVQVLIMGPLLLSRMIYAYMCLLIFLWIDGEEAGVFGTL